MGGAGGALAVFWRGWRFSGRAGGRGRGRGVHNHRRAHRRARLRPVEQLAGIEREYARLMRYRAGVYVAWGAALHNVCCRSEHGETIRETGECVGDALAVIGDVLADALAHRYGWMGAICIWRGMWYAHTNLIKL